MQRLCSAISDMFKEMFPLDMKVRNEEQDMASFKVTDDGTFPTIFL